MTYYMEGDFGPRKQYRCPQCDTNQPDYPMLLGHSPRALCAHYSHRAFLDFAFHRVKHLRQAALAGFATGTVLGAYLMYLLK